MLAVKSFGFKNSSLARRIQRVSINIRCLLREIERWCEESVYSYE